MSARDASGHPGLIDWDEAAVRAAYDVIAHTYVDFYQSTVPEQPIDLAMIAYFRSTLVSNPLVLDARCGAGRAMPHLVDSRHPPRPRHPRPFVSPTSG